MNVVVMGVAWTGRAHVAAGLARAIGARFIPGQDLHPRANRARLDRGEGLTCAERDAWLDAIGFKIALRGTGTVICCAALRRAHRDRIRTAAMGPVRFVHLHGPRAVVEARMIVAGTSPAAGRAQLDREFAALDRPGADEDAISVDISGQARNVIRDIARAMDRDRIAPEPCPAPATPARSMGR